METLKTAFLALLQGLTEFLPISSSAHLILPAQLLGWDDQGLAFDVAVHLGTLLAVLTYFRRDIAAMLVAVVAWRPGARSTATDARLAGLLAVATLPLIVAGFVWVDEVETHLRSMRVIGWATMTFAILLALADSKRGARTQRDIRLADALIIGLAQALAIIPGTSRSGITITAALFLGLDRQGAARFSFLLSIPAILGAALLESAASLGTDVRWTQLGIGVVVAGASAYGGIHFFLKLVERTGMMPYVLYRLLLGATLIILTVAPALSR
ncbi:MAG: undecaprenyl-diphosphate phosphatase [Pseudomonadales bacterium]